MKALKSITNFSVVLICIALCMSCTSILKLQKEAPTTFEAVYYQNWNAGIKEGGSGTNIYLEIKDSSVVLDSVYFRGQVAKLERNPKNRGLYVGRFKSIFKASNDKLEQTTNWSFQIKDDECIISYLEEQNMCYFKISNIKERETLNYPSTTSNKL